ncbi:MAG: tetratricopeptide repeat protein [Vicinamibacterales bacterium]
MTASRRLPAPWLLLAAAATLLVAGLVYVGRGNDAPRPAAPDGTPAAQAGGAYADPATCAECHDAIARTYALTGMARSLTRVGRTASGAPAPGLPLAAGAAGRSYYHAASDRHYTVSEPDGGLVQRRHQVGPGGAAVNVVEVAADYVIGSGQHARTFVHRAADGRLLQLPLSWYAERGGHWAMSPGYDRPAHLGFRRVIDDGCMSCHNAYPRQPVRDAGTGPQFGAALPEGIDCQRCHGPGQAHVDAIAAGDVDRARRAIVHPGTLDRERQLEVCLQCHLEPTSSPLPFQLRRYERPPLSYVPGTPLAGTFLFFDHAPAADGSDPQADKFEIAGAAYRLAKSACFQGSQMTCLTCHDPHDIPRGEAAVRHYTSACQSCHAAPHPDGPPRVAGAGPRETCVDCHMPRRRTDDAVHVVMTDHFIQRVRPARDLTAPLQEAATLDRRYQGEVALYYPPSLPATADNELYLALAQVQQGSNLAAGIPRLEHAIERHPAARVEFFYELARAHAKAGNLAEVVRWSETALARDASFAPALKELAGAATALGQLDRASAALERAVALRPGDAHALADLGNVQLQRQQVGDAVRTLERALELDASLPAAHNTLGLAALAQGDRERAERQFREAIRHQPDLADAHANLGNLLAGRQAYREAAAHFALAVRHDATAAAAHHGHGLVLMLLGEPVQALAALRNAARLQPGRDRIHTDIADLLAATGRPAEALAEYGLAVAANAADFDAHLGMGELLLERGRRAEARPHLEAALGSPDPAVRDAARTHLSGLR